MAVEARRFRRRKRELIHVEGFVLDSATEVQPDATQNPEEFYLFGKDDPETDIQPTVGTLRMTLMEQHANNALLDLITDQSPLAAAPKQYNVNNLTPVDVWANVKADNNLSYTRSWLAKGWSPGFPYNSGAPNDKSTRTLTGNCALPREFEGAWIKAKKIASGVGATITDTPVIVPRETNYAVFVKALRSGVGFFEQQHMIVSAAMVTSAGVVSFSEIEAQALISAGGQLSAVTHAYVGYLQTGTGVYPTPANTSDKLR